MGNNIKDLRMQSRLTQPALVELMGIPSFGVSDLSRLENDKARPTPEQEAALCRVLNAQPVELYGEWKTADVKLPKPEKKKDPPFTVLELVALLGHGKEEAKSIKYLERMMDISNRQLRRVIAMAYEYGYYVANDQDGKGYYLISTLSEARRYYLQERARALTIMNEKMEPLKALMEKMADEAWNR